MGQFLNIIMLMFIYSKYDFALFCVYTKGFLVYDSNFFDSVRVTSSFANFKLFSVEVAKMMSVISKIDTKLVMLTHAYVHTHTRTQISE